MRLIDADALIERISREVITYTGGRNLYTVGLETAELFTLEAPTIEAEPIQRGMWIFRQYDANPKIGNYHCSECGCLADKITDYCPNCGAKMEVEK